MRVDIFWRHPLRPLAGFSTKDQFLLFRRQRCGAAAHGIDRIVACRGPHQVDVVAKGEDPGVSLFGGRGKRFLPAPGLHDDSLRQIRMKNLIPANHGLVMLGQDLLQMLVVVGLQVLVSLHPMGLLESLNLRIASQNLPSTSSPPMWK